MVYIGERLLAGGFSLSGAQAFTPPAEPDAVWEVLRQAQAYAGLILLSQAYADLLGRRLSRYQQQYPLPPVLCVPAQGQQRTPVRETILAARLSLGLTP